ncbi:MAG: hypothetical protein ONB16_07490 [candidate division KSB1 bacterium]|nr:hypothetical protein [candidate division KSB1 bacterium]MDZ7341934.1 hypothetical protein [candidate division KSB1 bacterium]
MRCIWPLLLLSIILLACCQKSSTPGSFKPSPSDGRWNNINDYGRSLNAGRLHVVEVYAAGYTPGTQPFGVGERLLLADEYEQLHPDVTIEFVPQLIVEGGSEGEAIRTKLLGGIALENVNFNIDRLTAVSRFKYSTILIGGRIGGPCFGI